MTDVIGENGISISPLPSRLLSLVETGVAVLHVTISKDGYELLCSTSQAYPKLGLVPHKKYFIDEFIELTRKFGVPTERLIIRPRNEPTKSGFVPSGGNKITNLEEARALNRTRNLGTIVKGGVSNQLPRSSLCYKDFARKDFNEFVARTYLVADSISNQKASARISSSVKLGVKGAKNLDQWWSGASSSQRWDVLTNRKLVGEVPKGGDAFELTPQMHEALSRLNCPFRAVEGELQGSDTEDGEETGGVSFSTNDVNEKQKEEAAY
jgi:hypothetical protein